MNYNYRSEYIKCGKKGCKSCPHGPYWYGYWREGKRLRKKYFGKVDPRDVARERTKRESHPHDDIFLKSKRTVEMAANILGINQRFTKQEATAAFRKMTKQHHPDRGGDEEVYKRVTAAWEYINELSAWTWW